MTNELKFILRALRHRNYRLFFAGQLVSLVGTWMQQVAVAWLVYRLTGSAFFLGLAAFASQLPAFILTPIAGVLADRWDRYNILVATQILAMLQAFTLAALFMTGNVIVWQIIALSVCLGMISAFEMPARHAFVFEMIEKKEDLSNAIALNSSIFNSARLIGPSIAGILISITGEGSCFFLNGLSYLAVIAALLSMKVTKRSVLKTDLDVWKGFKEGFNYALGLAPIKYILILVAMVSLVGVPYVVVLPAFATEVLHGGAEAFGFLVAASGAGALLGVLYLASRKSVVGLGKVIVISSILFGAGLILFSMSHSLYFLLPLMVVAGIGMMIQITSGNTILQTIVEDDKRGRVMSLFTTAFIGIAPFGSLLIGSLASRIGSAPTLTICGVSSVLCALFFASKLPVIRTAIRPIYRKKGILPYENI